MMTVDTTVNPRTATPNSAARGQEPEWVVWLTVLVLLAIGAAAGFVVTHRTATYSQAGATFQYPADWIAWTDEDPAVIAAVGESIDRGPFSASVRIRRLPVSDISTAAQNLGDLALKWSDSQAGALTGYRVLNIEPASVGGRSAVKLAYAYVADVGGPRSLPIVARGEDILLMHGDQAQIITWRAAADDYDHQAPIWQRILASLKLG